MKTTTKQNKGLKFESFIMDWFAKEALTSVITQPMRSKYTKGKTGKVLKLKMTKFLKILATFL